MSEKKSGARKLLTRIAVLSALACIAWLSANFALRPVVVNQGGGRAASSNYSMTASIGGPVVSTSASTNFTINANTVDLVQAGPVRIPTPPPPTPPGESAVSFTGGGCAAPGRGASPWTFAGLAAMVVLTACRMRRRVAA